MNKETQSKAAADFVNAIKTIANKPENLDNLELYLSYHFSEWIEKHATRLIIWRQKCGNLQKWRFEK